jgi:gliding motility-associated-like protein
LLCKGSSFTLNAQTTGGLEPIRIRWFENGSLLANNALRLSSTVNWNHSTYTARIEDFCGSTSESSVNIRAYDPLSVAYLTPDTTICQGRSLRLVIRPASGSGSYAYRWSPGGYTSPQILITPPQTTLYAVTLSDNCSSLTRNIRVTVKPVSRLIVSRDTLICPGKTVVLRASVFPPQPAPAIEWSWGSNRQMGAVLEVTPSSSQVYTARYFDGCDPIAQIQTVSVNVYPPLNLAVSPDTTICPGASLTLYARAAGGKPPYAYNWRLTPPGADSLLAVSPMSNQTFTVSVSDGCQTSQERSIRVNIYSRMELIAYPESDTSICPQTEILLRAYPRGGSGTYQFRWEGASSDASFLQVAPPIGDASYKLTVTDACAAIQKIFRLKVWPVPEFRVNRDTVICKGASIALKAEPFAPNLPNNYQYAWRLPDQSWRQGSSLTIIPNAGGVYTLSVTGLCIANSLEKQVRVDVFAPPSLRGALQDTTLCAGKSLSLSVLATGGGGAPYLYRWQDPIGQTVSNRPQANFIPSLTGRYTVIANDRCNQSSEPLSFEVKVIAGNLRIEGLNNLATCLGQSLVLKPMVSGGSGSYQYFWNQSPTLGPPTWEIAPQASSQYTLRVTDGCQDTSIAFWVTIIDLPDLQISNDTLICSGSAVELKVQALPPSPDFTYLWRWGTRQYLGPTLNDTPAEDTEYTVEVSGGCIQTPLVRKVLVRLLPPLRILTSPDTIVCKGKSAILRATGSGGIPSAYQWEWRNSAGRLLGQTSTLQVIPNQTERYTVTLRDGGCSVLQASASVEVAIAPQNLTLQILPDTLFQVCPNQNFAIRLKAQNPWGELKYYFQDRAIDTLFFYQTPQNEVLTFEVRDKCVRRNQNVYIQTLPLPVVSLPAETTLCVGQSVMLQPSVAFDSGNLNYHWLWQGRRYHGASILLNPNSEGQLKLAVSGGCLRDTLYQNTYIRFYPRLELKTTADTSICPGQNVELWAQRVGGHPNGTFFQWFDQAGNFLANGPRLTVAPAGPSRYTVKASNLCQNLEKTITVDISGVRPRLSWLALSPGPTVCKNQEVRLWARAQQGLGNYTYTWRAPNLPPQTGSNFSARISATTTFYVSAYDGCSSIDTFIIARLHSPLRLQIKPDTTICPGSSATLWAQAGGGDGNYTYQWLPSQIGGNAASITVRPAQNTAYYAIVSDGCQDTTVIKSTVVRLAPLLRLVTLPDTTVCPGTELTLAAWAGGGLEPYAWQWKKSNNQILAHESRVTLRIENSLNLEAIVTDGCGTQKNAFLKVNLWPKNQSLTLAYLTPDTFICKGQSVTLRARAAQAQGNVTFTWSAPNNVHIGNSWVQAPSVSTTYYLKAQDACSALDTSVKVALYSPLQLSVQDTTICMGASVVLQARTSGGKTPVSVRWKWENLQFTGNSFRISPEADAQIEAIAQDACGFSHTQIVKVRVRQALSVKIEPLDTLCPGQSVTVRAFASGGNGSYYYEWYNKNGLAHKGQNWTFTPTEAETILAQVTDDCGSISAIDTLRLPYYAPSLPLAITNLPSDTLVCANLPLILSPAAQGGFGGYRWLWRPFQSENRVIVLQPNQTGIYTVRLEDKCAAVEKQINVISAPPIKLFLPSDTLLCRGAALVLNPVWEGGKAPLQWSWQLDSLTATDSFLRVPPNYEGEIRLSVTDACAQKEERQIRVRRFLPPAFAPLKDTALCKEAILTLKPVATAPSQGLPLHYQWFRQDSLLAQTETLTLRLTQDQALRLRISDPCGAFWEDTLQLTVLNKNPQPLRLSVSPPDSLLCPTQKIQITVNATGGNPPYTYRWQHPADTSWRSFPLVLGPISGQERYIFKAIDICGAEGIASRTFRSPLPLQAQAPDTTLCPGQNLQLKIITEGGKPPFIYQWQGLEGAQPWVESESDRSYKGKVIDACLKEQEVVAQIKIARPLQLRDTTFRICRGLGRRIEMHLLGGAAPFQWYWFKGNDTVSQKSFYWAKADENEELQVKVIGRCPASLAAAQVKIKVITPVEFDFRVFPENFCNSDTLKIEFIGIPPEGRAIWDFGTAAAIKGKEFGPYEVVVPPQDNSVTFKLFVATQDCFYDTLIKTLPIRPLPDTSFLLPPSGCWQDTHLIFRPRQIRNNYEYSWQMGPSAIPSQFNGPITPPIFFTRPGKHSVSLRVRDEYCVAAATQILEVWERPELLPDSFRVCALSPQAIRARPFDSRWSYLWYRQSTASTPFFIGEQLPIRQISADTIFWVRAVNEKNCTSLTPTPIFISSYPLQKMRIQRLAAEFAFERQPIQFRAEQDTAIAQYIWEFEGENRNARGATAYHTFAQNGAYNVILKGFDNKGCPALPDTIKITIDSYSQILAPNAFTPNGDGNNDEFYIYHQGLQDFEIQIFDRYGVLLYQSADPNFRWKGLGKNGVPLPEGVYVFTLLAKGKDGKGFAQRGTITLIR